MAQPDLVKFDQRALAIKLQAVAGTPETPSTATDGIQLYNGQSGTDFDTVSQNPDRPFFTGQPFAVANKRATISGEFMLVAPAKPGDAVDGIPACDILLRPGAMTRVLNAAARTTRYNPISSGIGISTAHWWHAGTFKQVYDARHALSDIGLEIGQVFKGQVSVQGSYDNVSAAALPTVTYDESVGPVLSAANGRTLITVDGGTPLVVWAKSLKINTGSDLKTKEYTGHKENSIDGRSPTFTLRMAKTDLADFNPWAVRDKAADGTPAVFEATMRVKGKDGRYGMVGIRGQLSGVGEPEIDKDYGWELTGPCVASDAGGDEFFIEFGDVSLALSGTLSDGQQGVAYAGTTSLTAEGEYGTLVWSISAGALPTGLAIDGGTGVISGTPTAAGPFTFTVQATDGTQTATREQTVTIS